MELSDIQTAWQSQPPRLKVPTTESLRRKARRFRFERLAGTIASLPFFGAFTLVFVAAAIFGEVPLCRAGCALIAASLAYTSYRFVLSEWNYDPGTDCLTHFRSHLVSRRGFLRSYQYCGALPTVFGAVLATLGWVLAEPDRWTDAAMAAAFDVGLQAVLCASNSRTVARLEKEIKALDAA